MIINELRITSIDGNRWLPNKIEDILVGNKIDVEEVEEGLKFRSDNTYTLKPEDRLLLMFKNEHPKECFVHIETEGQTKHYKILKTKTIEISKSLIDKKFEFTLTLAKCSPTQIELFSKIDK
ncbi:hypothetical protein [Bacillus pumilus]|uniref:Uncharacterized protein n=1 Tax=Bacillus pumilus TaxID=1408 RepID=A0AAD0HNA0_BACPU|nr:hypothetical protein [Bacillus pumilus]AVM24231.1 hypothetical protein C5695_10420 [Bacillus pumilus]TYS42858.1 hypothetical protein FZC68_10660 [Bacillus pumilus]